MKFMLMLIAFSLLLAACKHGDGLQMRETYVEKRTASAAEIHHKIPGTWTNDTQYDNGVGGNFYHVITLGSDGGFSVILTNEMQHVVGTWRLQEPVEFITNSFGRVVETRALQDHGATLVVTAAKTNHLIFDSGGILPNSDVGFYPVIFVDDHELVLAPGWSVGGRYRFTR